MVASMCDELNSLLEDWRRDLHRHPELGWTEFRTTARIVAELQRLGFKVVYGRELYGDVCRLGLPTDEETEEAWQRALAAAEDGEIDLAILERLHGGYTGCVATWRTDRPGPTRAFRFDIDALPITESADPSHRPAAQGWRSRHDDAMHACGHDGHAAIGIALAHLITKLAPHLRGTVKLIFQPAEEGGRGAAALVEAGHLDDVDEFVALHLGLGAPAGTVSTGTSAFLATTKFRVDFQGSPSHAGRAPEKGRNALLAAATAVLNLHALTQFGEGDARLNVGTFHGGSAMNIVPEHATFTFEVRGDRARVHQALEERAIKVLQGAALMHDADVTWERLGRASSVSCDPELVKRLQRHLQNIAPTLHAVDDFRLGASEDATIMMQRVHERGGRATYGVIGADLKGDHHQPTFDVCDASLYHGLLFVAAFLTMP